MSEVEESAVALLDSMNVEFVDKRLEYIWVKVDPEALERLIAALGVPGPSRPKVKPK